MKVILFETGLKEKEFNLIIDKIKEKILYINGWVCIRNFIKNQLENPKIRKGIERALEGVPDNILDKILKNWQEYKKVLIAYHRQVKSIIAYDRLSRTTNYSNSNFNFNPLKGGCGGDFLKIKNSGKNTKAVDNSCDKRDNTADVKHLHGVATARGDNTADVKHFTADEKKSQKKPSEVVGLKAFQQDYPDGVGSFAELRAVIKHYNLKPFYAGDQLDYNCERVKTKGVWQDFKGSFKAIELREKK